MNRPLLSWITACWSSGSTINKWQLPAEPTLTIFRHCRHCQPVRALHLLQLAPRIQADQLDVIVTA
jgi:hypothetical protein